jgi:CxxC motif-containing protein (DUF1111 family)
MDSSPIRTPRAAGGPCRCALMLCLALVGCAGSDPALVEAEPGSPLPGLSAEESARFTEGEALFNRPYAAEEGLGPLFNQTRCSSCHDLPTLGGHGAEPVTKVSHFDDTSGCSLLEEEGGDLLQASLVPELRAAGYFAERVPSAANAVTELRPPPLYGLGLVAGVSEEDIVRRADPDDSDGDGVSGRVPRGPDGLLGRFGAKGQHGTLRGFIEGAANGELGLTTPSNPVETSLNGVPLPGRFDPAPEPELGNEELDLLTSYVRFLAPPQSRTLEEPEGGRDTEAGRRVFARIGCATCHVPTMRTGPSDVAALDRKRFRVYSDLLLHDMGTELSDVCAPGASPSEWLTARLVGLGHRHEFLHNRRAQGLDAAIMLHGGEAGASRDAYGALDAEERESLMRFLRSL